MKLKSLMILVLLVSGCVTDQKSSLDALADATRPLRADLAACVAEGEGDCAVEAQALISTLDSAFN